MALDKRYNPAQYEPQIQARWAEQEIYRFDPQSTRPVYSIDTPPPTVSGHLHLGHVFSYSQTDFMARFFRMRGFNVYYPMGFDDNGLPTDRLVEKILGIPSRQMGREAFTRKCLEVGEQAGREYRALWERLGLSVDWRYTYRTIDEHSRRCSQHSFIALYRQGRVYRDQAPAIWCPECATAIAQADLEDSQRQSEFVTLRFTSENGQTLPIATTRPELLAACVAVFVHPQDARYREWTGRQVKVPLFGQLVPVLTDPAADPEKGTGAVMCCTFGDQTDVAWWKAHHLPFIDAIDATGRMTAAAGELAGLPVEEARRRVKERLFQQDGITDCQITEQSIRVHERCDTPVEYRMFPQWFVRVLDQKEKFLELGQQLRWHPEHMQARYRAWVENLNWDWCISRQRLFGVPFPVWYCARCGAVNLAEEEQLPVDPLSQQPARPCSCGSTDFTPENDVMDTWATSSLSPAIATGWLKDPQRFEQLFPTTLRPQAHEIIRTWAFYTIVKTWYHFGRLPWQEVLVSGWAMAGEGMGKISKSKGGGPTAPMAMLERYSADALRYWAASTSPGKDTVINEEKIQQGGRWLTKLWNVARFAEPFIRASRTVAPPGSFTPADRWILTRCTQLVEQATDALDQYEYALAKTETEAFFWRDLADNYLEMAKLRLYDPTHPGHTAACCTLRTVLITLLKLLAPFLPYITDALWMELFAEEDPSSIHQSTWPGREQVESLSGLLDLTSGDLELGELLVAAAGAVRRFKSEHSLSLGANVTLLKLSTADQQQACSLEAAVPDLMSVTRANLIEVGERRNEDKDQDLIDLERLANGVMLSIRP